ncbi:MAG: hypothetical protein WCP57_11130 [Bacteroidota bacterium]
MWTSFNKQIKSVNSFDKLISYPMRGEMNAVCWTRKLSGDFAEIVEQIEATDNITVVDELMLDRLVLSKQGELARATIIHDYQALKAHGASPTLNLIQYYNRDVEEDFFPTDVYSFHVDRSPIPTDTFLCTYFGDATEIISNTDALLKIQIPEIRAQLINIFQGSEEDFEDFLSENYYDLHYEAIPNAPIISTGLGNLWRIAVDCASSNIIPCIHRAPIEKNNQPRLLLIC